MSSILKKYILNTEQKKIEEYINNLKLEDNWSLVSFVDEMAPLLLMEANLKYSNFHSIKMSLFLRELTIKEYFNRKTEKQLIKLMAFNFTGRNLVSIQANREGSFEKQNSSQIVEKLLEEIDKGNSHNAFYYAREMLQQKPKKLSQILLEIGSRFIPDTLGHSFSCFYPVVKDYIYQNSGPAPTALLSYIMYLCRYNLKEKQRETIIKKTSDNHSANEVQIDYNDLTFRCASGEGIVNLHHMITLAIYTLWEDNEFDVKPTWEELIEWVEDKEIDEDQKRMISGLDVNINIPSTYKEFSESFLFNKLEKSMEKYFALLDEDPDKAIDWLFRLYSEYYKINWDPHYFTGLYAAFTLYYSKNINKRAGKMAIYQALKYFADAI